MLNQINDENEFDLLESLEDLVGQFQMGKITEIEVLSVLDSIVSTSVGEIKWMTKEWQKMQEKQGF